METPRPKPVGAQYRTHSLRRRLRQAGQPPGIQQEEMKRPQPGIRLRRDSRSGRESPRSLSFRARFSFLCWPDRGGGLAALAPLRGAKASAAAAPVYPGGQGQPRFRREQRAGRGGVAPASLPAVGNVASKAPPGLSSRSGPASSQFPSPSGLRKLKSPPGGQGGTWGDWSPREGRPAPKGRAFRRRPSALAPRPLFVTFSRQRK